MGSPLDRSRVTIRVFWLIDFTVAVAVTVLLAVREFLPSCRVATAAGGGGGGGLCLAHAASNDPNPMITPTARRPRMVPPPAAHRVCRSNEPASSRSHAADLDGVGPRSLRGCRQHWR